MKSIIPYEETTRPLAGKKGERLVAVHRAYCLFKIEAVEATDTFSRRPDSHRKRGCAKNCANCIDYAFEWCASMMARIAGEGHRREAA